MNLIIKSGTPVTDSEAYESLVCRRSMLGWSLATIQTIIYFAFILLVAFKAEWLSIPLRGGVTTLGVPLALAVGLLTVVLTAYYVRRANVEFDALNDKIRQELEHE